jgi:hypothetical protein
MDGVGNFTDSFGQSWSGLFFDKKAPGLRFKLEM